MDLSDPFDEVLSDTKELINKLNDAKVSATREELITDIRESIIDLNNSILVMKNSNNIENSSMVQAREFDLQQLQQQFDKVLQETALIGTTLNDEAPAMHQSDAVDLENNTGSGIPHSNDPAQLIQQQMYKEQSTHLDQIHMTMNNLHNQAMTMGNELMDQGELLDNLDENIDSLSSKLQRGRRNLQWVYEKNKEKWNDCCIIVLIVVLVVLLVMAIII